ncbi:MAG TPA: cob(I)yrinic acid a,c-diamide adenosyltransferase, partial [Terrimicrobiaceae bacterium]
FTLKEFRIMKIYTRTGDDGSTSLISGARVSKTDVHVDACGTIDELSCALGIARATSPAASTDKSLATIQSYLFELGAELANPERNSSASQIDPSLITWLEAEIDSMAAELPPLKNFILPGGTAAAAQIHFARAICRRAERAVVNLSHSQSININHLKFLNRLSDFLFILARHENFRTGTLEEKWQSKEDRNNAT